MPSHKLSPRFALTLVAFLFLLPVSADGQTADKAKPTGSISGRVTLNEKGLADIVLGAQSSDRPGQQPSFRAKTDVSGHYCLMGLPAGQYQIVAIAPALTVAELIGNPNSSPRPGQTVVLGAGEDVDDVDIKLVRGGVITGRITDADGKPVVQERVNLQIADPANPNRQPDLFMWNYQMNQTDDRGIYRIYGLPTGRYRVSVGSSESGFISSNNHTYYSLTFYGDTNEAAKASIVEVQEGSEATNIDIRVGRAANTFIATGRVVDADTGQPIPGIRLMYGPARPNQPFYGGFIGLPTGTRGEFRLEGLEPGHYGLSVSATFDASAFYSESLLFDITDADVTNLELKATRGQTLTGIVSFEGTRAKELQQQIGSLRVLADVTSQSNPQSRSTSSSALAADGKFNIAGVRPGKARLFVGAVLNPALRGVTALRVERGGVDVTQILDIQPGESIADLQIVAALGSGTIRGIVTFVGGSAPANARLFVNARREGANTGGSATVDTRGRFAIANLVAGTYSITLNGDLSQGSRRGIAQTQIVTVTDDAEAEVTFIIDIKPREGGP